MNGHVIDGYSVRYDVPTTMRDGTILRSDIYRPTGSGPWPVIVVRGPYGKAGIDMLKEIRPRTITDHGYMLVLQDTRSRFASDGAEWRPWIGEGTDGADTIEWAARLPDSTGRVATLGPSYLGNTQWMAAIEKPAGLVAIAPSVTWSDPYDGLFARGGAIELGLSLPWSLGQGIDVLIRRLGADPTQLVEALGPLFADFDNLAHGVYAELPAGRHPVFERHRIPDLGYQSALEDDAVAEACSVQGRQHLVGVPSFTTAGWFDLFLQGSLDNFVEASQTQPARLLVGPWSHAPFGSAFQGQVNFGLAANADILDFGASWHDMQLDWLDRWLRPEVENERPDEAPVKLFVMGVNEWRDEHEWPLSRAVPTPLYFGADGTLSREPEPHDSSTDFDYDPMDPVPTVGGNMYVAPEYPAGMFVQSAVESRRDVIVFTTPPLLSDLEVTGRVRARLHATTDGLSTDWVVRLCDVDAEGVSRNVADGILRAETVPDAIGEYEIDLWSTSIVFRAGHRIRVQVTSSCFPRWDRNLNLGAAGQAGTESRIAHQRIHYGASAPSHIILPVV